MLPKVDEKSSSLGNVTGFTTDIKSFKDCPMSLLNHVAHWISDDILHISLIKYALWCVPSSFTDICGAHMLHRYPHRVKEWWPCPICCCTLPENSFSLAYSKFSCMKIVQIAKNTEPINVVMILRR
ncbi:hypothetical protein GOODEAATRI_008874 [Goodea atripinnis]|uniref:Uncharacterized protein n=1 Tax=Goodea atripinnis TaxID=208336 RepID=A0ABV0NIQ0_9TELE